MMYILYGFVFGLLIPYAARRFAKFMPATPGYALWQLFRPGKKSGKHKINASLVYTRLRRQFYYRSVMSGLIAMSASFLAYEQWGVQHLGWRLAYIWILLLLAEIDYRTLVLPDILTVPLLIMGYVVSVFGVGFVGAEMSALGAAAGYLLPVVSSLALVWKNKDAFGGGDIKLLAAVGAWLGIELLLYVILASAAVFAVYAAVRRRRSGAFGPAVAFSAIMIALYFF